MGRDARVYVSQDTCGVTVIVSHNSLRETSFKFACDRELSCRKRSRKAAMCSKRIPSFVNFSALM